MTHQVGRFWDMNYRTSATLKAAAVALNILSDVSDDIAPVIRHLAVKIVSAWLMKGKMTSRLTGGPAAAFLLSSLPSALTEVVVNKVSDVGRETGGDGMKTGTGFRQPMPRELEGAITVMMVENGSGKTRDRSISGKGYKKRQKRSKRGRDTKKVASVAEF